MNDIMHDLIETTIRNRYAQMVRQMTTNLYDDINPPPTRWNRFVCRWRMIEYRIRNAWLVLTGKADIE